MENTQKNAGVRRRSNTKVRYMTQVGMLSAVATVLMLFEFPLPFVRISIRLISARSRCFLVPLPWVLWQE